MHHKLKILSFLFLALSIFSCGKDGGTIDLTGWEISHSDADYDTIRLQKDGWKSVTLPASFKLPMTEKHDFEYMWLKAQFTISGDHTYYYGISITRMSQTDKIYLNGVLIGEKIAKHAGILPMPRNYILPPGLLRKGTNEVYIKLGIYPTERAGVISDFRIQPENEYDRTELINNLLYRQLPLMVGAVYISFILILTVLFSGEIGRKMLINFTIPCFGFAVYIYSLYVPHTLISFDVITGLHAFAIINLLLLRIYLIIQSVYKIYFTEVNRILIPLAMGISTFLIFIRSYYYTGLYYYIVLLIIGIPIYLISIYRLHKINPGRMQLWLSMFFVISFVTDVGMETIFVITGSRFTDLPSVYFSFIYFTLGAIIIGRELMERRFQMEILYDRLKVLEEGKDRSGRELSITESSEDKLKTIIGFLNDNYTSDLSREGMASAVNMNPNYMSRLFKSYTGKKISEYINELRVKDAAERLRDRNARIIDIALAVGFDSIVTFNRAFKHVLDMTPTEFREKN